MPAFPRDIYPNGASQFIMPGALRGRSLTGRQQRRGTMQAGRRWVETYPNYKAGSAEGRAFAAAVNDFWLNGTAFTTKHPLYLVQLGLGTGAARINGPNQTGKTLNLDGWTGGNPVLRKGDIIRLPGIDRIFDVTADPANHAAGVVTVAINPPIFAGGSPTDDTEIVYGANVELTAYIAEEPAFPLCGVNEFVGGFRLAFEEAV